MEGHWEVLKRVLIGKFTVLPKIEKQLFFIGEVEIVMNMVVLEYFWVLENSERFLGLITIILDFSVEVLVV